MKEVDTSGDGTIDKEEFFKFLSQWNSRRQLLSRCSPM